MSEFADRAFVAGGLIGIRSFAVDQIGRLLAPQQKTVFLPGENVAECRKDKNATGGFVMPPFTWQISYESIMPSGFVVPKPEEKEPEVHQVGGLKCGCGFYAYFDDGDNPYHKADGLRAIVEGYGVATVGTRGFRAEKAKLLALVVKPKREKQLRELIQHNYPDVVVFRTRLDALDAFPLVAPEVPTPETAEDFWTRSAS